MDKKSARPKSARRESKPERPEIVKIGPTARLSLAALGFRPYHWVGFLVVNHLIDHERVVRAYGANGCMLLGRRRSLRLYAWAGSKVPRFARKNAIIAGVDYKSSEFFVIGNRSMGERFELGISLFSGFSVKKGRDARYVQRLPLFEKLKNSPGQYPHEEDRAWGMRWEGDMRNVVEGNALLHELDQHLDDIGVVHDTVYWTPDTGWVESFSGEIKGSPYMGPDSEVAVRVPGDSARSCTHGEYGFEAGSEKTAKRLDRFSKLAGY